METTPSAHPLRGLLIALAATVLVACLTLYLLFQARIERAEEAAREAWYPAAWTAAEPAPTGAGYELWLDGRSWRAGAVFGGRLVYGGERGLLVSGDGGGSWRPVTVLDGLPAGRVTAMAELGGRLYLGLGGGGLARWDGRTLERFALPAFAADWVTTLAPGRAGRLLCATRRGQLLELEPGRFRAVVLPGLPADGLAAVALSRRGPVIGTFRHGLYRLDGGRLMRPGGALPPLRSVTGLAVLPDGMLLAGTDAGLAVLSAAGDFQEMLFPGRPVAFAGHRAGQVLCACVEDQVYAAPWADWSAGRRRFTAIGAPGLVRDAVAGPAGIDLLTDRGAFRWTPAPGGVRAVAVPAGDLDGPSVMALAAGAGAVWLGYFDGGVERRDPAGRRDVIETPALNTVNHLAWDGARLWAGTAQGLWTLEAAGSRPVGRPESPLRSAYVNQVIPAGAVTWVCHGQGLSALRGGAEELFYALHGLPSNKVYCAAPREGRLYVGTLGGLAVMAGDRVATVYQADNSPLRVNWITALLPCAQGVVVGTYGGGFQLLAADGTWREFRGAGRRLNVNPNALCAVGPWILAGTLEAGLWRLDPAGLRAVRLDLPLPSPSVQAVLAYGATLYVATDNGVLCVPLTAESLKPERAS